MTDRTHQVTRLEGFSDAVFGFALTLLVVRLETPRTSEELSDLVRGSLPFALMFAMVCWIWWEHNAFFRRYGLQDAWTAFLNCVLLFVVLFYVYPLKFLTTSLLGPLFGVNDAPGMGDGRYVMLVYSAGVILIFGAFTMLYVHARSKSESLGLTASDRIVLRFGVRKHLISAAIGTLSFAIAAVSSDGGMMAVAGFVYALMGPLHAWNGYRLSAALNEPPT